MGDVIRVDNEDGELPPELTETGTGGLLSSGYLADEPAASYLEVGERPVYVLTHENRGVEIDRETGRTELTPGSGYRTIVLVTDRRLLALVGDSDGESGGDRSITVPLLDVESAERGTGRRVNALVVTSANDRVLAVYASERGLRDVVEYVTAASQAWIHVENRLDDVKRGLVEATSRRDAGEYDDALASAREAVDVLEDVRERAERFDREWDGRALSDRVEQVAGRCRQTLAEVRLGRARQYADEGERLWRDEEYAAAHDAFDRAIEEYDAVAATDTELTDSESVRRERARVERTTERLEASPFRAAVEADEAARAAEDAVETAERWEAAIEHYSTAMELDWGADERRFEGDPEEIRERLGTAVERLVSARRSAATDARQAGDWYVGADQYDVALAEYRTAREQYERALSVARDRYPDAVDHLEVELEDLEERIERAEAARDGEAVEPVDAGGDDEEPAYDVEATIGDPAPEDGDVSADGDAVEAESEDAGGPAAGSDGKEPVEDGGGATVGERLRRLDEDDFVDVVAAVLEETGWTTSAARAESPHDVEATKETPVTETMHVRVVHRPDGEPVGTEAVEACAGPSETAPDADVSMLATSASLTEAATKRARRRQLRVLDDESLSVVFDARDLESALEPARARVEE